MWLNGANLLGCVGTASPARETEAVSSKWLVDIVWPPGLNLAPALQLSVLSGGFLQDQVEGSPGLRLYPWFSFIFCPVLLPSLPSCSELSPFQNPISGLISRELSFTV